MATREENSKGRNALREDHSFNFLRVEIIHIFVVLKLRVCRLFATCRNEAANSNMDRPFPDEHVASLKSNARQPIDFAPRHVLRAGGTTGGSFFF
jgi:hypothetical protein